MPAHRQEEPNFTPVAGVRPAADGDPVLAALLDLADAADRITAIAVLIRQHVEGIRAGRELGASYREILAAAPQPLVGSVLTDAVSGFEAAGTRYRQIHGRALQREGMTLQQIAGLWGLTRQRISELLQTAAGRQGAGGDRPGESPTVSAP